MEQAKIAISHEELKSYGYSEEVLPKTAETRDWGVYNYVTVWMGAVHNLMSYMTVAGFFVLGLSVPQVLWAVMTAAIIVSIGYVLNGYAGTKYGIGYSMLLRSSFGVKGSIIPAVCRGLIAGVVFFGTKTIIGAQSFNVIFTKIFPGYMDLLPGFDFLGLDFPTLLSFVILWVITVGLFLGGMKILSLFSKWSSPIIYIFIVGAAIWAINVAGGFGPILAYVPAKPIENWLVFIACVSALVSNWGGPIVNIADLTQRAKTPKAPLVGLPLGMIVSYILFAITSVGLLVGTQIAFGLTNFDVVAAIDQIGNPVAVIILLLALNIGSTSYVVFGNLLPSGLQMTALFPKIFSVKSAAIVTAILGTLILPWKLVNGTAALYMFYSFIGSMYGPITGIMLVSFFIERKRKLDLSAIYVKPGENGEYKNGFNMTACGVLIVSFMITLSGAFLPNVMVLATISKSAFISGLIISSVLYALCFKLNKPSNNEKKDTLARVS
ncbi:allantoin permease [Brevibacillus reuszeri]|uniref:Allantoin permease n=1 Tax=Brevibacillus reuszeri TaxID=54915 RepID=A0A0K9YKS7_9BACL|nr:cytosine permease [Brevibacillus reuszeri]KNB68800.1 allantoin transporter [Brevibacillus reuszeri]MED1859107.1 cytosine permease [Brevibacillus reuszeri]GED69325.1 allantoin permease [Brevibacillus reuszeri]